MYADEKYVTPADDSVGGRRVSLYHHPLALHFFHQQEYQYIIVACGFSDMCTFSSILLSLTRFALFIVFAGSLNQAAAAQQAGRQGC